MKLQRVYRWALFWDTVYSHNYSLQHSITYQHTLSVHLGHFACKHVHQPCWQKQVLSFCVRLSMHAVNMDYELDYKRWPLWHIEPWRSPDVSPVILGCFLANFILHMQRNCFVWACSQYSDITVIFSDPNFLKHSNNLVIRWHFQMFFFPLYRSN